jgi:hypothetical protein
MTWKPKRQAGDWPGWWVLIGIGGALVWLSLAGVGVWAVVEVVTWLTSRP